MDWAEMDFEYGDSGRKFEEWVEKNPESAVKLGLRLMSKQIDKPDETDPKPVTAPWPGDPPPQTPDDSKPGETIIPLVR